MSKIMVAGLAAAVGLLAFRQEDRKAQLRESLKDRGLVGTWVYDDFNAGVAQARQNGKPLFVVIRCVP